MATKKKAAKKAKRTKKVKKVAKRRTPARKKKVAKKVAKKLKKVAKKAKKKPVTKAASKPVPAKAPAKPVLPAVPPNEERVGSVTHYYTHLGVAVVQLDFGAVLREGDTIHVKGFTTDFTQRVQSMEVDHLHVMEARGGQSFGLKVREHAREHDVVYRVKMP